MVNYSIHPLFLVTFPKDGCRCHFVIFKLFHKNFPFKKMCYLLFIFTVIGTNLLIEFNKNKNKKRFFYQLFTKPISTNVFFNHSNKNSNRTRQTEEDKLIYIKKNRVHMCVNNNLTHQLSFFAHLTSEEVNRNNTKVLLLSFLPTIQHVQLS